VNIQFSNWRDYAMDIVDDGVVDPHHLLIACLKWMSHDEVYEMLDANELTPRFRYGEDDEV